MSVAAMDGLGGNCLGEEVVTGLVARGRVFTFSSTIHPPPIREKVPSARGRSALVEAMQFFPLRRGAVNSFPDPAHSFVSGVQELCAPARRPRG